jgi:hypothetical protein
MRWFLECKGVFVEVNFVWLDYYFRDLPHTTAYSLNASCRNPDTSVTSFHPSIVLMFRKQNYLQTWNPSHLCNSSVGFSKRMSRGRHRFLTISLLRELRVSICFFFLPSPTPVAKKSMVCLYVLLKTTATTESISSICCEMGRYLKYVRWPISRLH